MEADPETGHDYGAQYKTMFTKTPCSRAWIFLFGQQWLKILLWKAENKSLRILKTEVINSQISKRLHLHYEQAVGSWSNQVHGTQEKLLSLSLTLWNLLANYFTEKSNTTRTARRHFILMIDYFTLHNICRLNFFTR